MKQRPFDHVMESDNKELNLTIDEALKETIPGTNMARNLNRIKQTAACVPTWGKQCYGFITDTKGKVAPPAPLSSTMRARICATIPLNNVRNFKRQLSLLKR